MGIYGEVPFDGIVEGYETCLVVEGTLRHMVLTMLRSSLHLLRLGPFVSFSLVTSLRWPLSQLDVKNMFLHGNLGEEVYMEQPPRFVAQGKKGQVCRLRKALYGLKQSLRAWFGNFNDVIQRFRMHRCKSDHSVFSRMTKRGRTLLIVFVNDIIITRNDTRGIEELKIFLQRQFHTKIWVNFDIS